MRIEIYLTGSERITLWDDWTASPQVEIWDKEFRCWMMDNNAPFEHDFRPDLLKAEALFKSAMAHFEFEKAPKKNLVIKDDAMLAID